MKVTISPCLPYTQTQYRYYMLVLSKKLLHHVFWITLTFCQFHFSHGIKQPINPAIWTLSPLQEAVLTYTVGIKISSSYWYVPAALTWHDNYHHHHHHHHFLLLLCPGDLEAWKSHPDSYLGHHQNSHHLNHTTLPHWSAALLFNL